MHIWDRVFGVQRRSKYMNLKRVLTSLIGFPLVVLIIALGTPQIIDFAIMIIAIICMYEYFNVISKICKPIKWLGFASTLIIFLLSLIPSGILNLILLFSIPVILLILFLHIILTDMKFTFKDVAYTFLGIAYVTGFIMFLALIVVTEKGKLMLGYTMMIAWATDVFAYTVGKYFGKHHFSKISPKKTIEGCIAGMIGAVIVGVIYAVIANHFANLNLAGITYLYIGIVTLLLSIISQVGDFAASSIKRFADCKDYGTMLPGHGGMLDRIDSVIFIAPFVYMIICFI